MTLSTDPNISRDRTFSPGRDEQDALKAITRSNTMALPDTTNPTDVIHNARLDAERKAWDALGRYKFYMYGYWAAAWVKYNQLMAEIDPSQKQPNPFSGLVKFARDQLDK